MALTIVDSTAYDPGLHKRGTASATRCGWHGVKSPGARCNSRPVKSVEIRDAGGCERWISACERATYQIADLPHEH
ncbi:hypothetical protein GCM10009850_122210 [Nonomuraea monospora]|uniref:Uncharacterized protein n=1 Tax=Nonomuraea monospora TaxID=568818 RepID=A0ABN3D5X8_9ACTN